MTPDWEQAAERGDVLAAADLAAAALAQSPGDPDVALAALVCQSNAGRSEEVFDIFLNDPSVAQDPKGFASLIYSIAVNGALELVGTFNLYPAMEQVLQWHPALGEFSLRIAARYLACDEAHGASLKHLEALLAIAVAQRDDGLAARLLMACPAAVRPIALRALENAWGGLPGPVLSVMARFDEAGTHAFLRHARSNRFQDVFPSETVVRRSGTGTGLMSGFQQPIAGAAGVVLDKARLARGVRRLREDAKNYLATETGYPADAFRRFSTDGKAPILIVSTGRVGTRAMERLLSGAEGLAPFHSLAFHMENGDHNSILYRMLAQDGAQAGGFTREIRAALSYRLSEFAYCCDRGMVPVIVNHLDSILIPIYLAVFPDARVIRMHRDPGKTLRSLAYKKQFNYSQLRNLIFAFDDGGNGFRYRRDTALSIEQECVWYMHVTDMLADIYAADLAAPGNFLDLDMERAFSLDGDVLENLTTFLDDPGLSSESCRAVFAQRVNEKAHYAVDAAKDDPVRLTEITRRWSAVLDRDGGFSPA